MPNLSLGQICQMAARFRPDSQPGPEGQPISRPELPLQVQPVRQNPSVFCCFPLSALSSIFFLFLMELGNPSFLAVLLVVWWRSGKL